MSAEIESLDKFEITPQMIEAGAEALACRYFDLVDSCEYPAIARTVFEAMAVKIERPHHEGDRSV